MNVIKANLKYNSLVPLDLNKVVFIMIHHIDAITATPEQIHQWHLSNGWSGAGYNEYIRKDGTVYIMRGDNIGAHCANLNSKSYGIALEGDYDKETILPIPQFNSLVERLKYNKSRFKNLIEIGPHSKYYPTSCPGKYLNLESIIKAVDKVEYQDKNSDIQILQRNNIINSPDYWIKNAVVGGTCNGEYVRALINNMANKLK